MTHQHLVIKGYMAALNPHKCDPLKAHALHSGPYPVSRLTFDQDQGFATLSLFTCGDR